jgi:cytochrome P450
MPPVPVRRTLAQTHRTDRPRSGMTSSTHGPAAASTGIRAHKPRFNPLHPDVLASPYGSYQRMRQEAPVLFDRRFGWLVFRYDDVERALRDPRLSARRPAPEDQVPRSLQPIAGEVKELRELQGRWLLCADPPRHSRLRALVSPPFSPRALDSFTESVQRMWTSCSTWQSTRNRLM